MSDLIELPIIQVSLGSSPSAATSVGVDLGRLLPHDHDAAEVAAETGHVDLALLLLLVALGEEQEIVPAAQHVEGRLDVGDRFDRVREQGRRQLLDASPVVGGRCSLEQVLETVVQAAEEHTRAVTVCRRVRPFDVVQRGGDRGGVERRMVDPLDEIGDGAVEQDVVLPQGVVGIEDQVHDGHPRKSVRGGYRATAGNTDRLVAVEIVLTRASHTLDRSRARSSSHTE